MGKTGQMIGRMALMLVRTVYKMRSTALMTGTTDIIMDRTVLVIDK